MAKDKLITLLIEAEKRERLKQHCANLGLTVSQVLSKCIDDILNGSIDPSANSAPTISLIDIDIYIAKSIEKALEDINAKLKEQGDRLDKIEIN
jgi:antitoxin component of RelBE/YafQ-DinJ toxin-antitoxin module